jgi:hypothetical protein
MNKNRLCCRYMRCTFRRGRFPYFHGVVVAVIVCYLYLQLHMQSVSITTGVVCSNLDQANENKQTNKSVVYFIYKNVDIVSSVSGLYGTHVPHMDKYVAVIVW